MVFLPNKKRDLHHANHLPTPCPGKQTPLHSTWCVVPRQPLPRPFEEFHCTLWICECFDAKDDLGAELGMRSADGDEGFRNEVCERCLDGGRIELESAGVDGVVKAPEPNELPAPVEAVSYTHLTLPTKRIV